MGIGKLMKKLRNKLRRFGKESHRKLDNSDTTPAQVVETPSLGLTLTEDSQQTLTEDSQQTNLPLAENSQHAQEETPAESDTVISCESDVSEVDIGEQLWTLPNPEEAEQLQGDHQTKATESYFQLSPNSCEVVETLPEWDSRVPANKFVQLSNLSWTPTRVWGRVIVSNITYEKEVRIRLSCDNWLTFRDHTAVHETTSPDWTKDSFVFSIEVPENKESTEMDFAVCYTVNHTQHWDNNNDANYSFNLMPDGS